jgi:hypothetical protein
MAATEQPVNLIEFKEGEDVENAREEEKYLYKYFQAKGPRVTKKGGIEDSEGDEDISMADAVSDSDEDPELKAFADKAIKDKMRELNGGESDGDSDDEVLSALEDDDELNQDSEDDDDEEMEEDDEGDFFEGEDDLQDVNLKGSADEEEFDDEDDDEDSFDEKTGQAKKGKGGKPSFDESEEEMGSEDEGDDYGMEVEDDEEEDDGDNIFSKSNKKGGKDNKKKKETSIFASYEEFAHLLEGDTLEGDKKKPKFGGPKIGFNKSHSQVKRDFKKRGSGPSSHSQKKGGANKR